MNYFGWTLVGRGKQTDVDFRPMNYNLFVSFFEAFHKANNEINQIKNIQLFEQRLKITVSNSPQIEDAK